MRTRPLHALVAATAAAALALTLAPAHAETAPAATASRHGVPPIDPQALRAAIAGLPDEHVTSAQVSVTGRGGHWRGRSGVRDVADGDAVPDHARFRIASATKMFTAALVLQLVGEGRLALTDTVQSLLPGVLPAAYPPITVGQLLDHTSGLPESTDDAGSDDPRWVVQHRLDWHSPLAVVGSATRQPMRFAPGTHQAYNGVNYFLAGLVVERVTGHSYDHELRHRLLRPLGLRDTYLPGRHEYNLRGPHTVGYVRVGHRLVDVSRQSAYGWAESGLVSTTDDLARFLRLLLAGRVVAGPQLPALLTVPEVPYVGSSGGCASGPSAGRACFSMGLQRTELPGGLVLWGKSGGQPGYSTLVVGTADAQRVLAASFTTTGNRDGSELAYQLRTAAAAYGLTVPSRE